jgi:eukaryotic-like serine/threonine-protein kinase
MGEVYKARDTRLDRIVAIKVSNEKFSERFEREARAVAALNHPNICQLYDVGPNYLVLEYVEGSPVAPTESTRKLLDMAVQIADGMAAAHAGGFVHRDLKPANVLVTSEGRVKILDFGLAKTIVKPDDPDGTQAMTLTNPGSVAGTAAYMSPEQARGAGNLDTRSDQFSCGLMLYEMAAARHAFKRSSAVETLAAIIREDPEPLPASVPAPLRWIILRCLAKEPRDRYESSRDLFLELRSLREHLSDTSSTAALAAAPAESKTKKPWGMLAAFAAGVALTAAVAFLLRPVAPPRSAALRFTPFSFEQGGQRTTCG